MDSWVLKAMERWPNVPALFGWLGLDRRGRWLIKGEAITHPRIVETMNRNYGVDEHGRWYFQNGPQRGYIELEYAPFMLRRLGDALETHTGLRVERPAQIVLDEEGAVLVSTEHGLAEVAGTDLDWILDSMRIGDEPLDESYLTELLDQPSHTDTPALVQWGRASLHVIRLDAVDIPEVFGFQRTPQPHEGERQGTGAPD